MDSGGMIMDNKKRAINVCTAFLFCSLVGCSMPGAAGVAVPGDMPSEDTIVQTKVKSDVDYSAGVSDDKVSELLNLDQYEEGEIKSHNVEKLDAGEIPVRDTVSIELIAGNLTGFLPQTISKDVSFVPDPATGDWKIEKENCTSWVVDNELFPASRWKMTNASADYVRTLMGDTVPSDDTGDLYVKFTPNMGLFAFRLTEEVNDPHEHLFGTMGNGMLTWIGKAGRVEQKFKFLDGVITDKGDITLNATTDEGKAQIALTRDFESIGGRVYDIEVLGGAGEDKVYKEELPTFNVASKSMDGEFFKPAIGVKKENISPELTWDEVEGASCYAILMIDEEAVNWLHWYAVVEGTHVDEGQFKKKEEGYVGPYPEDTHGYRIYVVALRCEPKEVHFVLDMSSGDSFETKLTSLNTGVDGIVGNVIAYGMTEGLFDHTK